MRRKRVRHSVFWTWYYGLPMTWGWVVEYRRARRAGARTARMIRDMNEQHTMPMPKIVDEPSGRHALRDAPHSAVPGRGPGSQLAL
jgi:hypothetical protein